ncbi:MAG TPA: FHA domain-containing protein, partial [Tepidisphaeraceae bacterium]|nr:FHA domain-containing protein [Tepidisphaeraceae bacterium]
MAPPSSSNSVAGASAAALVPQGQHLGKPALPLTRAFTLIGSRHRAHLNLLSKSVSKSHAALISTNSGFYIRDLASRERVIINGKAQKEADLKDGDQIKIGSFAFKFSNPASRNRLSTPSAREAVLHIDGSDVPMPIEGKTVVIGRRPTADIALIELSASTIHAIIFEIDGQRYIRDLGSRTGTFVNGRPIHHHPLAFDDTIKIGDTVLRYTAAGAEPETTDLGQLLEAEGELAPIPLADVPIEVADAPVEIEPEPAQEPEPIESPARVAARRALEEVNLKAVEPEPLEVDTPSAPPGAPERAEEEEEAQIPLAEDFDLLPVDTTPGPAEETIDWAAEALAAEQQINAQKRAEVAPIDSSSFDATVDAASHEPVQSEQTPTDLADIPVEILPDPTPQAPATVEATAPIAPVDIEPIEFVAAPADHGSMKAIDPEIPDSFESLLEAPEAASESNANVQPAEPAFEQAEAPSPFEFTTHEAAAAEPAISEPPLVEEPSEDLSFVAPVDIEPSSSNEPSFEEAIAAQVSPAPEEIAPIAELPAEAPVVEPLAPTGRKGRKKREPKPAAQQPAKRGRKKKDSDPDQAGPSAPERVIEPGIEPPIPSAAAEFSPIEVLDETAPSPESAQAIEPEIASPFEISLDESSSDAQSLSDTQFGRAIEAFSGSELGPLVEEPLNFGAESKSAEPFVQAVDIAPSLTLPTEQAVEPPAPSGDAMIDEANAFLSHESQVQTPAAPEPVEKPAGEQSFTAAHDLVPPVQQDVEPNVEEPPVAQTLDFHHDVTIEPARSDLSPATPILELPPEPEPEIEQSPADHAAAPSAASALESIETALAANADSELSDLNLDWLDAEESPAATQVNDLAGLAQAPSEPQATAHPVIEEPAGVEDLSFQEESDDLSGLMPSARKEQPPAAPAPATPAPAGPPPAPVAETPAPAPDKSFTVDDLMSGMSRDAGSFLGGLPLPMAPVAPAAAGPGKGVVISVKKDAPAPQQPLKAAPLAAPPSDRDIFDSKAVALDELPEALGKIGDETEVLGRAGAPARAPATPPPPSAATRPGQKTVQPPRPARKPAAPSSQPAEATLEDLDLADFSAFGAAPRSSPGAFDGLALPPRAQVDVFSMLPIPSADDPFLGGRQGQGNTGAPSQGQENRPRVQRPAQPPTPAASRPSTPGRDAPAPEAPIQPTPPPPAAQPTRPTKRKKF